MKKLAVSFNEIPKTKEGRLAMWLGLATIIAPFVFVVLNRVIRPVIDPVSVNPASGISPSIGGGMLTLILSFGVMLFGYRAIKGGEKSWLTWLALVPAILFGSFWLFMFIGHIIYPD